MTTDLFKDYMDEIIKKRPGALFSPPSLLVMDKAASHSKEGSFVLYCGATVSGRGHRVGQIYREQVFCRPNMHCAHLSANLLLHTL